MVQINYCLVKQNVGALIEDSPGDYDRYPDFKEVTGEVVFTPMIAAGQSFQLKGSDGEMYTVPITRIRGKIVEGKIWHEDEEGVPLFAGGEGANPSSVAYRVTYSNLRAGEDPVQLNPIAFTAIPGETIDLTTVTPITNAPRSGVVKGDKGEPGLKFLGVVDNEEALPKASNLNPGDAYVNISNKSLFIWNGSKWEEIHNFASVDPDVETFAALIDEARDAASDAQIDYSSLFAQDGKIEESLLRLVDMKVKSSQSTPTLGPELVTDSGWTLGAGWSGDLTNGFTHVSGDTSVLEYDSAAFGSGLFLVNFTLSSAIPPLQNLDVSLGDSDVPYLYTGGANVGTALLVSTAGPLKFTPVRTPWSGKITNISVREVVGNVPPSMIWQDDQGQDAVSVRVGQAGQDNFFLGDHAGRKNVTGYSNVVLGHSSMWENVSGYWNVAVGWSAMRNNVSGSRNTAVGMRALVNNTTGYRNTVLGQSAMVVNSTGHSNIAIGADAMLQSVTGNFNVAIGLSALASSTEGSQNVGVGSYALNAGTTSNSVGVGYMALYAASADGNVAVGHQASRYSKGASNSALGASAGINNVNGNDNTVIGFEAGRGRSLSNGDYSRVTAIGKNAGRRLGTGHDENTLVGYQALANADGGVENTAIGVFAGLSAVGEVVNRNVLIGRRAGVALKTGGDENTLIGNNAGNTLTSGAKNIIIGYNVQASSPTASNEINIGNLIKGSNTPGDFEVSIEGKLRVVKLPKQDPNSPNQVWNDNGTLKVSAG